MLRRATSCCLLLALLGASLAGAASADQPRLLLSKVRVEDGTGDLVTASRDGTGQRSLLANRPGLRRGLSPGETAAWSPDGRFVAFSSKRGIWLVAADGRGARRVPGTRGGYFPIFSPDGNTLAFVRNRRSRLRNPIFTPSAIWLVDLETGDQRRLTALRDELQQFPTSFSPDGSTLLVTRASGGRSLDFELVAIRFDGRTSSLLVGRGSFGVYSPDGSRIVFMRYGGAPPNLDLYTVDPRGDHLRRITDTPGLDEIDPNWNRSGRRIVYSAARFSPNLEIERASIWQVNRDGTCATELLVDPAFWFFAPSFQPGSGENAGPLSC